MLFNPKTYQPRHSRAGGNPVRLLIRLDSRLRENDNHWGFYIKLQSILLREKVSIDMVYCYISCFAFFELTTGFPVFSSISLRVLPAMVPPCLAITRFCSKPSGCFSREISV